MAKMPKNHFQIGDRVIVNATAVFDVHQDFDVNLKPSGPLVRQYERTGIPPTEMIVVGGRFRKEGIVHPARPFHGIDGAEYEPGHLEQTGSVFVYQVRQGFMRKIQEVLPEDMTCLDQPPS